MAGISTGMKMFRAVAAVAAVIVGGIQLHTGLGALVPDGGKPAAALAISTVALSSTEATDFGAFTPQARSIPVGKGFFIYAEARNVATTFEAERVKGRVSVDVLIANDHGETIIAQDGVWTVPFEIASTSHRSIAKAWLSLQVAPLDLPEGHYEMTLRFHDALGGSHADHRLEIEYRKPAEVAAVAIETAQR